MRHTTIIVLFAALFLVAAPVGSRADEPEAAPTRLSTGEVGPVLRAIDRHLEAAKGGMWIHALRLDGDIQLQVGMHEKEAFAPFCTAVETDAVVLDYLARDAVEVQVLKAGRWYATIRLSAAEGSAFVPPPADGMWFHEGQDRIVKIAHKAKLSVNPDLWKANVETLPDGSRLASITMPIIAWGAVERDFVDLVAKDPVLHAVGAYQRDVRSVKPPCITEEPAITVQWRQPARP